MSSSGYRYEGDNESTSEDGGFSEGEHPKSRKVLDEELEQATSSDRVPSLTFDNLTALDDNMSSPPAVQGDVTPRPALKFMQPPTDLSPSRKREQQRELLYPIHRRDDVIDSTPPSESSSSGRQLLKSFEPEEELWPYPRAPLDDRALDMDGEVVELDFNEISALSDPHIFEAKVYAKGKKRKDKKKDKEDIEDTAVVAIPQRPTPAKGKGKMVVEQPVVHAKNGVAMGLDRDAVTESLLAAASPSLQHGARNRNEFVREVLTLIHVSSIPDRTGLILMVYVDRQGFCRQPMGGISRPEQHVLGIICELPSVLATCLSNCAQIHAVFFVQGHLYSVLCITVSCCPSFVLALSLCWSCTRSRDVSCNELFPLPR